MDLVPAPVAYENSILPLLLNGGTLVVAGPQPSNREVLDKLGFILNRTVVGVRADPDDIRAVIGTGYGPVDSVDSLFPEFIDQAVSTPAYPVAVLDARDWDAPVGRLVARMLGEAINLGVQRLAVVPHPDRGEVEYHVGGAWAAQYPLPWRLPPGIAGHVVRLAGMALDYRRHRRAGGEFRFDYLGMIYTVAVAVADTVYGPRIDFTVADRFELA